MILAVLNQKGGVGKTTVAFHLAKLSARDRETLAVDIDPQGNLTSCFIPSLPEISNITMLWQKADGGEPLSSKLVPAPVASNLSLIGADLSLSYFEAGATAQGYFKLRNYLRDHQPAESSWVVIDCPPNLGLFSINAMLTADYVLIPVDASRFTMQGLNSLFASVKEINRDLRMEKPLAIVGIVLSNANVHTTFVRDLRSDLRSKYGRWVLDTVLPSSVKVREAVGRGEVVSEGAAMAAYLGLYKEILGRLT